MPTRAGNSGNFCHVCTALGSTALIRLENVAATLQQFANCTRHAGDDGKLVKCVRSHEPKSRSGAQESGVRKRAQRQRRWLVCYPAKGAQSLPCTRVGQLAVSVRAQEHVLTFPLATLPVPTSRLLASPSLCACAAGSQDRKPSPLQRGGTLQGAAAAGKDASDKFKSMAEGKQRSGPVLQMVDGRFSDFRWTGGRWDLSLFRCLTGQDKDASCMLAHPWPRSSSPAAASCHAGTPRLEAQAGMP